MVMPYGRKSTLAEPGQGPTEIDFNRLWDLAYVPVIEALGFEAVRADQDTGSLIVTQMLERLYFADLVLADMTVPNGNVYYEIGVRHAARETGCVLLAANWSRQLFDVAQMRTLRYPLPEGEITEATAEAIRLAIKGAIPRLGEGRSPMHESIKGYPSKVDEAAASTTKERMTRLAAFQGEVRAIRAAPRAQRMQLAQELAARHAGRPLIAPAAIALLRLLGDCADVEQDWGAVVTFIDGLPANLTGLPEVKEQRALACSYAGRHIDAIAELERLIADFGPTPERLGLLGGRCKRLYKSAEEADDRAQLLSKAIEHYEHGMQLDLNEYYCSSNLPRLYRLRSRTGDEERAQSALRVVIAACERARKRGAADPWLRPTLLVAAFDAGDAEKAEELADEVWDEGPARWQLATIRGDLETSIRQVLDDTVRERLGRVIKRFA
jgi:tetratricopeptide (TPR) repeat protein